LTLEVRAGFGVAVQIASPGEIARQNHQAQRLSHAVTVPAAFLDFDNPDEQIG